MISKARGVERGHGQAHAVHRHRPLRNEEPGQRGILPLDPEARRLSVPHEGRHRGDAVDVPLNEVAPNEAAEPQGPLEVDAVAGAQLAERGADEGLGPEIEAEPARAALDHGEARAVDRDARAERAVFEDEPSRHREAGIVEPDHVAHFLDEPGEHRV